MATVSWDLFFQRFPAGITSLDEVADDYQSLPLGQRAEVIAAVCAVAPATDFSDPTWGQLDRPDCSVEFNLGSGDPVRSLMLHVRGGSAVTGLVVELQERLGVRAVDMQDGAFFEPENAATGLAAWRRYRDQVMGHDPRT